jgi:SAM-dependent methyltransferase
MRTAAEAILSGYPNFQSISGTAESTNMPAASVDFVTAGQAFHWFDSKKAKSESIRILKPGGWAVLVWNERQIDSTQFLRDYELLLLKYGTDYEVVRSENAVGAIAGFFSPEAVRLELFSNRQEFDFEGLRGRVVSSSYTPEPNHPNFKPMLARLRNVFDRHQQDGTVSIDYDTKVYYGHLRDAVVG